MKQIAPNQFEYRGHRVTHEHGPHQQIARVYWRGDLVGYAADLAGARAITDTRVDSAPAA